MEQLINFIIRPPRAEYNPNNDLLDEEFMLKGKWYQRKDVQVLNSRGDVLQCSHYMPCVPSEGEPFPCVIYCHGNSGCRVDASEAALMLLPSNITVFSLDFSGSGLSGGEYVTLGWNEKDDLKAVVDYLRADGNVSLIGLWGRSMGAVTSLMYGAEDPSIAGMVLDSPFSDLVDLMMELVDTYKYRFPRFTVKFAIHYMRRAILKKAKFDIMALNTIKVANCCFVPVLFGHGADDDFIQPHHSERIFDAYTGDKNIIKFEGDHNSARPQFYFDSINIFFHNVLQPPKVEVGDAFLDTTLGYLSNEEGSRTKPVPSTSNMISFEFSDYRPSAPHVSTSVVDDDNDDDYVEYQFGDFADFPSSMEEEESMLIEAMMESLKDSNTAHPNTEEPQSSSKSGQLSSSTESTTTSAAANASNLASELPSPGKTTLSTTPSLGTAPSGHSDTNSCIKSSSSAGMSDCTTATVTVTKNPTNNFIDAFMRCWR
ncbi:uncharacterized protein LOC127812302 isoform X2 [Diospyros lotus]|uniref:uncharacterized protein LOC127812302 isoform X2 n=1 Tax=Diospyros lotus TaxID=55363 RepID=UPI00224F6A85|nr:uncharacterized protein LOC127812302 isoform X2 [Diospyros lotus]